MANRAYLYSTDKHPSEEKKKIIGISEWSYEIPIVFKVLLSGDTEQTRSMIWCECEDNISIVGDMDKGIKKLKDFLSKVECDSNLKEEAISFLEATENNQKYLVLECGEIHDMLDCNLGEANAKVFNDILNIDIEIEQTLIKLSPPKEKKGFLNSLFGKKEVSNPMPIGRIGLGEWSNILYFDLSEF